MNKRTQKANFICSEDNIIQQNMFKNKYIQKQINYTKKYKKVGFRKKFNLDNVFDL